MYMFFVDTILDSSEDSLNKEYKSSEVESSSTIDAFYAVGLWGRTVSGHRRTEKWSKSQKESFRNYLLVQKKSKIGKLEVDVRHLLSTMQPQ